MAAKRKVSFAGAGRRRSLRPSPALRPRRTLRPTTSIYVSVPVPSNRYIPRTVSYTYPINRQNRRRVRRLELSTLPIAYRTKRVRVIVPKVLPYLPGSYVTLSRKRINVHSRAQLGRLMEREYNRRRYHERKNRRRKARNGQLAATRSDKLGMIAEAHRRGWSNERIEDVALVNNALR